MKHNNQPLILVSACLLLATALPAGAQPGTWQPDGASVLAGRSRDGTAMVTLGLQWQGRWQRDWWGGQLSYSTEALLGHWRVDGLGGRESYTHVAVLPVLRNRFGGGQSPWFVEGGIGLSLTDNVYRSRDKQFSTAFNFVDMVGVGYSFGASGRHELGVRVMHVSNAAIKKPNPGTDTIHLRYALRF